MKNLQKFSRTDFAVWLALAAAISLMHVLLNGQYGFHRDELDILMNARHLDWGFVAYPPLTPLIARLELELFGPSLVGMRLAAALAQGLVALLVGSMARDLGAKRIGQVIAILAVAVAPVAMTAGTLIQYMSFDYLCWVLVAFCFVRLLVTEDARWWLGIGAAIGLGMQTKYTIVFWVAGLAAGVLLTATRRYLRSGWLWAGAGLALLIFLPNLMWQVQHHFISLNFLNAIHTRDIAWGRADGYLLDQLIATTNPFTLPLWVAGLLGCLFLPAFARFRALGWMYLVTFGLLFATRGRGYYLAPAYGLLLAAGAAWLNGWLDAHSPGARRLALSVTGALLVVGCAMALIVSTPVAPINSGLWKFTYSLNDLFSEMIGWPEMAEQVGSIYAGLPESQRAGTVILAGNYGEAGALELYGPRYNLPPVISGANSMWARGYGSREPTSVIVVGFEASYTGKFFAKCSLAGSVHNRYNVRNEETSRHTGLYVCSESRRPWSEMWQGMQWFQ